MFEWNSEWISVEDRLPEPEDWDEYPEGYPVLAIIEYTTPGVGRDIGIETLNPPQYRGEEYGTDKRGFGVTTFTVTHWMELPDMPGE